MRYLIFALTCCFFLKTFLIDKMAHANFSEKDHTVNIHVAENMHLDCHGSKTNLNPFASDKSNGKSSCPHDCDFICLCSYFLNLQNTLMITNEDKNNFFSNFNKNIFIKTSSFTSQIINPPERPPTYNS